VFYLVARYNLLSTYFACDEVNMHELNRN
jgi:hypothetical protein